MDAEVMQDASLSSSRQLLVRPDWSSPEQILGGPLADELREPVDDSEGWPDDDWSDL